MRCATCAKQQSTRERKKPLEFWMNSRFANRTDEEQTMSDNLQATDALRVINLEAKLALQQAAHDAEIAELRKEIAYAERCAVAQTEHAKNALEKLSEANAACAMKDDALKAISTCEHDEHHIAVAYATDALSATSQQVSDWEREQLEPLRAQVAALKSELFSMASVVGEYLLFTAKCADLSKSYHNAQSVLANTQAAAEQYKREIEADMLANYAREWDRDNEFNGLWIAGEMRDDAERIRNQSKETGK
jgi:ribosomal protein L29